MSDEPRNPELENLLDLMVDVALSKLNVSMPAKIVSFNATTQFASVQPLVKDAWIDELDRRVVKPLPEIHDVPVWFFGAQAAGRITVPVGVGDYGILVFSTMSIARWKLTGGVVDPGDDRRHDYNDCYFMPGMHTQSAPPTTAPTNAIVLHGPNKLGGPTGTEPTMMGDTFMTKLNDVIDEIVTALNGIVPLSGATVVLKQTAMNLAAIKTTNTEVK